jgi:hypothetical protein
MVGLIVLLFLLMGPEATKADPMDEAQAVERAFRETVELWATERFETLWERGDRFSRQAIPKEMFLFRMRDRALQPACCFRQIQEVKVSVLSSQDASVATTMGFDSKTRGNSFDAVLTFYLRKEEGEWRVTLEEFLSKPDETLHRLFQPFPKPFLMPRDP